MNFRLDEYAHLNSCLHQWYPQYKLIGLGSLMAGFAAVEDWGLVPGMLAITVILYGCSRLPLSFLLTRLKYPSFFLLMIVAFLPFVAGDTILWQWHFISIKREGCLSLFLISSRFFSITITALVLLGTTPFLTLIKSLRSLGLSVILSDMLLLSYRYLFEIGSELEMMKKASQLRGFQPRKLSGRNLGIFAALLGSLLIRSYEQSERVYLAMKLRGYGYQFAHPQKFNQPSVITERDRIYLMVFLGMAGGLILAEVLVFN